MLTGLIVTSVFIGLWLFELFPAPLKPTDLNSAPGLPSTCAYAGILVLVQSTLWKQIWLPSPTVLQLIARSSPKDANWISVGRNDFCKLEDAIQETEHAPATNCSYTPALVGVKFTEAVQSKTSQTPGVD